MRLLPASAADEEDPDLISTALPAAVETVKLKGFPWLVFYLEFETHLDVWRVLHAKREMPVWLGDEETEDASHLRHLFSEFRSPKPTVAQTGSVARLFHQSPKRWP